MISRGDMDLALLQKCQSALTARLLICIHRSQYDLQNKLLHVLHAATAAISAHKKRQDRRSTVTSRNRSVSLSQHNAGEKDGESADDALLGGHDRKLVKALCLGVGAQRDSATVCHWMDFLLITLPTFRNSLFPLLFPLIDCIVARLDALIREVQTAYDPSRKGKASSLISVSVGDADFSVLLNGLERVFTLAIDEAKVLIAQEDEASHAEKSPTVADGGFLSFMSSALGATESATSSSEDTRKVRPFTEVLTGSTSEMAC